MHDEIREETRRALKELLDIAKLPEGSLVVVGCSSSEILGSRIGKGSSPEIGEAVAEVILEELNRRGLYLAAQCCEHLNRCLIVEMAAAEKFGYTPVCVRPRPKAGGSFATAVWERMAQPTAVEQVQARAGLDIGQTLIGMHLRAVAVPVRLQQTHIGEAFLTAARTRAKFIGGVRADYPENP